MLGAWRGRYVCLQGETGVEVSLTEMTDDYAVRGTFEFFNLPGQQNAGAGEYRLAGAFDPALNMIRLDPAGWIVQPTGYRMVGFTASPNADWSRLEGGFAGSAAAIGCTSISLAK